MKKILFIPIVAILLMACPLEEETPEPYNGIWVENNSLFDVVLTLDNDSYENINTFLPTRGRIDKVDDDTFTLTGEDVQVDGTWISITLAGVEADPTTYDWEINGTTLTLTDVSTSLASTYTKQ